MTLYVVTDWQLSTVDGAINVDVTTDVPVDLWLAVVSSEPAMVPRYIVSRGIMTPCGYDLRWPPPQFIHQQPPGPSLPHHFPFYCGQPGLEWWGTVSDMPQLEKPAASYPPMPLGACPIPPLEADIVIDNPPGQVFPTGPVNRVPWIGTQSRVNWPEVPAGATEIPLPWFGTYFVGCSGSCTTDLGAGFVEWCTVVSGFPPGACNRNFVVNGLGTLFGNFGTAGGLSPGSVYENIDNGTPGNVITLPSISGACRIHLHYWRP